MDRLLRQFLAIGEHGSITAAARSLGVTQPTLTANMQKLEDQVGMPILLRSPQGARLTPYGQTLFESAQLMQRLYDNTLTAMRNQRDEVERGISIGSGYTWWNIFLRDFVFAYREEFPTAPIQIRLGNQLECLEQLLAGDTVLFLSHTIEGLHHGVGTAFIPLSKVSNGYFVRSHHPLLGAERTFEDILAYPRATSAPPATRYRRHANSTGWLGNVENPYEQLGFAFASNAMSACVDYVRRTDAFVEHTRLMAPTFAEWGLHEVKLSEPWQEFAMGIYVLTERRSEPKVEALIDRIVKAGRAILPAL